MNSHSEPGHDNEHATVEQTDEQRKRRIITNFKDTWAKNLGKALAVLKGKKLASFEHKTSNAGSKQSSGMSVLLGDISVKRKTIEVSFVLSNLRGTQKETLPMRWELTIGTDKLAIFAKFGFLDSKTKVQWALLGAKLWDEDNEAFVFDGKTPTSLTGRAAANLQYLGMVWYQQEAKGSRLVRPPIEASKAWTAITEDSWPEYSSNGWNVQIPPTVLGGDDESIDWTQWAGLFCSVAIWAYLSKLFATPVSEDGTSDGLVRVDGPPRGWMPNAEAYTPRRPIDLSAEKVQASLHKKYKLKIPWHVVEAACAALNAGKHVVFTGPPGCGKSKLAIALAEIATGHLPLVATASPAWTSGDLIGRYMPRPDGHGLSFRPGLFLRAVNNEPSRWLLIDEFNRADIDSCFGELFSVLAGDIAELPFEIFRANDEETDDESGGGAAGTYVPLRIVPSARARQVTDNNDRFEDYSVPESFRLLGTMNDADRSNLHQLSFALQRRIDTIRVEAPEPSVVAGIIQDLLKDLHNKLALDSYGWRVGPKASKEEDQESKGKHRSKTKLAMAQEELASLFCSEKKPDSEKHNQNAYNLVAGRVVGVATVNNVITFLAEGLRSQNKDETVWYSKDEAPGIRPSDVAEEVVLSYLAMALVLSVFPQLDALTAMPDRFKIAVQHILNSIADDWRRKHKGTDSIPRMIQISKGEDSGQFVIRSNESIVDFLCHELETQYATQPDIVEIIRDIQDKFNGDRS